MFKWIILFIIFTIYSIIMFMFGRGFGIQESCNEVKSLKWKVMLLENDLRLLSVEDNKEPQSITNSKMQNKNIKNTVIPPQRPKLNMIRETYSPLDALRNPNYKKILSKREIKNDLSLKNVEDNENFNPILNKNYLEEH